MDGGLLRDCGIHYLIIHPALSLATIVGNKMVAKVVGRVANTLEKQLYFVWTAIPLTWW
jgi:hypothetical protein